MEQQENGEEVVEAYHFVASDTVLKYVYPLIMRLGGERVNGRYISAVAYVGRVSGLWRLLDEETFAQEEAEEEEPAPTIDPNANPTQHE